MHACFILIPPTRRSQFRRQVPFTTELLGQQVLHQTETVPERRLLLGADLQGHGLPDRHVLPLVAGLAILQNDMPHGTAILDRVPPDRGNR